MKSSLNVLDRQAVKATLDQNWHLVIELNTEILSMNPADLNAKIRMGKAYLHLGQFPKAKKIFKEILELDPLNQIAKKNYEYAKQGKIVKENHSKTQIIIKEPGTTTEIPFNITEPKITSNNFTKGDEIELKFLKKTVQAFYIAKDKKVLMGNFEEFLCEKLCAASEGGTRITAVFMSGTGKSIKLLLRANKPIFKGQKQEVKPYVKQTGFDEDADEDNENEVAAED